jgi:hypothetical protein
MDRSRSSKGMLGEPWEPFARHATRVGDRSASWIGLVPHRRKAFGIDDPAARLGEGEDSGHVLGR